MLFQFEWSCEGGAYGESGVVLALLNAEDPWEKSGEKARLEAVEGVICEGVIGEWFLFAGDMGVVLLVLYGHEPWRWCGGLSCRRGFGWCLAPCGGEYGGGGAAGGVSPICTG